MDELRREALRYLGHRGSPTPELGAELDRCLEMCLAAARPRDARRVFALGRGGGLSLPEASIRLPGRDIARRLEAAERAAVFAVTLGAEVDALIRRAEPADLSRALILDACATALVEARCDRVCAELAETAHALGLCVTARFSPGYGDLPLELQPAFLASLDAGRHIGLTCTESLILLPRKSVTAIVGFVPRERAGETRTDCAACPMRGGCRYATGV